MAPLHSDNPFVSIQKTTDNVPAILHPLVLLAISDNITRHTLRDLEGPVVGALLGQQNGRQVTIEHTFDFSVRKENGVAGFDITWFQQRLQQMRVVHADRSLDLVGWYTVLGRDGPTPVILDVHRKIQLYCRDSTTAVLLAFHPEDLGEQAAGGRLPLTLFETRYEQDEDQPPEEEGQNEVKDTTSATSSLTSSSSSESDNSPGRTEEQRKERNRLKVLAAKAEKIAVQAEQADVLPAVEAVEEADKDAADAQIAFKLREITYTVETEEAERISIDFVARGAANASATEAGGSGTKEASVTASTSTSPRDRAVTIESDDRSKRRLVAADDSSVSEGKGKAKETEAEVQVSSSSSTSAGVVLSPEDEELISTLTTRANAIRMLQVRLQLLRQYLEALPADAVRMGGRAATATAADDDDEDDDDLKEAVDDDDSTDDATPCGPNGRVGVSLPILRSIQALVQRLPLVVPPPANGAFEEERRRETNDVHLEALLLDDVMSHIGSVRQTGGQLSIFLEALASRGGGGGGGGGVGSVAQTRAALFRANSGGAASTGKTASGGAPSSSVYHTIE